MSGMKNQTENNFLRDNFLKMQQVSFAWPAAFVN